MDSTSTTTIEAEKALLKEYVNENLTWEFVDRVIRHEKLMQRTDMRLKTSSRRLFSFISIYSFLQDFFTARDGVNSDEWCTQSALYHMLDGVASIISCFRKRIDYYNKKMERLACTSIREGYFLVDVKTIESRHVELLDPDKKIWQRLYAEKIAPEKVVDAYNEVSKLLPDEAMANYNYRTGLVHLSDTLKNAKKPPTDLTMTDFDFYEKYIRSDIVLGKSNKLSGMFSENFEILPDINIKVPRRLERYFNVETNYSLEHNFRFPSNHIRGLIFAYFIGNIFGGAFSCVQLYLLGFTLSAASACRENVLDTPFSKLKQYIKNDNKTKNSSSNEDNDGEEYYPCELQYARINSNDKNACRKSIVKAVKFVADRVEKASVTMMRTPIAEHESDGYMADWLSLQISKLLGRKVSASYALLFIVNWVAHKYKQSFTNDVNGSEKYEILLKKLTVACGLTYNHKCGMVVPVIGFGSGMTNRKLRQYAVHCIENVIGSFISSGKRKKDIHEDPKKLEEMSLMQLSARLFKNNDVMKRGQDGKVTFANEDNVQDFLEELKTKEFVPNERRRKIHEEEYTKSLHTNLKMTFRFGVCGFQHPLPASSDKPTQVSLQLLKQRQTFVQRETAAAVNWTRLLQFLFPSDERDNKRHQNSLPWNRLGSNLNRHFISLASKFIKRSVHCERVVNDIISKFNADILPLGKDPDHFLMTKAGLVIEDHARENIDNAMYSLCGGFNNQTTEQKLNSIRLHISAEALKNARNCVLATTFSKSYNEDRPFLPRTDEAKFVPIPLFGVEPLHPLLNSFIDNTANKCNDSVSDFWLEESDDIFKEALVSHTILTDSSVYSTLVGEDEDYCDNNKSGKRIGNTLVCTLYDMMGRANYNGLHSDKPRKHDPTPWSSKNTGQSGRSTTDFSPNSVIVLLDTENVADDYEDEEEDYEALKQSERDNVITLNNGTQFTVTGQRDIFLAAVETQRTLSQTDVTFPRRKTRMASGKTFIRAPDISPVFRHGGKLSVLSLKHTTNVSNK